MMYKFTGFTEKANLALNAAIEKAENMGHTYIGTEHLLLGLLQDKGGVAASALSAAKADGAAAEELIRATVGIGSPTVLTPNDFTPRCKHIIMDVANMQAHAMGHSYVGTEHLLSALLKETDSAAVTILRELGVSLTDVSAALQKTLGSAGSYKSSAETKKAKNRSNTPTLNQFGRDLTEAAGKGMVDPVIGRSKEIERVIQILSRRTKNNPCLIGEPGVGKTAIAEGLALKISAGEVPETLRDKRIVAMDLTGMVAGTKYRGDFSSPRSTRSSRRAT